MRLLNKIVLNLILLFLVVFKANAFNYKTEFNFGFGFGAPLRGIQELASDQVFKFADTEGKELIQKSDAGILDAYGLDFNIDFRFLSEVGVENYFMTGICIGYRLINGGFDTKDKFANEVIDAPSTWMIHRAEIKLPLSSNIYDSFWLILSPKIGFNFAGNFQFLGKEHEASKDSINLIDYGLEIEPSYEFYGVRLGIVYGICFSSITKSNDTQDINFLEHTYVQGSKEQRLSIINELKLVLGIDPVKMMEDED